MQLIDHTRILLEARDINIAPRNTSALQF